MPIEVAAVQRAGGAYEHVRAGIERELELHRMYFGDQPFHLEVQLGDVRAGRPVRVTAGWLPPGARAGTEVVVVHPDDRVVETDYPWVRAWVEETNI